MNRFTPRSRDPLLIQATREKLLSDKALKALQMFDSCGPGYLWHNEQKRLSIKDAELICTYLQRHKFVSVQPFDFPNTLGVWNTNDYRGVPYRVIAVDQLLQRLAELAAVDRFSVSGFCRILPGLNTRTFRNLEINEYKTRLGGVFSYYNSSPSAAVLEVINTDPRYIRIRRVGLTPADFPEAATHTWKDKKGSPTAQCMNYTKLLILKLANARRVNPFSPAGFKEILSDLNARTLNTYAVNIWGTTLTTALQEFAGSPSRLVLALINSDTDFKRIKAIGIQPYDFPKAPNSTWVDRQGKPTQAARQLIKELVITLLRLRNLDAAGIKIALQRLSELTYSDVQNMPVNYWGTTIKNVVCHAYGNKFKAALEDFKRHIKKTT